MSTRVRTAQLLQRVALLVALICFWISGPATLHHTDEPVFYLVKHSSLGHATAPVTPLPCAACEWEQSFAHPPAPTVSITCAFISRLHYAALLRDALHPGEYRYVALRGPPVTLS